MTLVDESRPTFSSSLPIPSCLFASSVSPRFSLCVHFVALHCLLPRLSIMDYVFLSPCPSTMNQPAPLFSIICLPRVSLLSLSFGYRRLTCCDASVAVKTAFSLSVSCSIRCFLFIKFMGPRSPHAVLHTCRCPCIKTTSSGSMTISWNGLRISASPFRGSVQ